ncbi:MAG: Nicotinamidase/pyrazinamidase [uncultured marine phage]|uniref:nicotinamidase n=1 Tax=uncultured marine phage TaxID=707152 RepID=A0A8D9CAG8_9VIRU|nr:MAG: Nicotinamidase/pyrazinamidase [uncultured marine phage]
MKAINRNTTVFWNVDTQIDFMDSDGALYVEGAEEIKPTLKSLTDFAKENNIRVINTMDWHYKDSEELSKEPDFATTFPPHCMADTTGATYVLETEPEDSYVIDWSINMGLQFLPNKRNITIRKDKFDVFEGNPNSSRVVDILKKGGIDTVVVYGVAENVCVNCAVNGLVERGLNVVVVEDGIKGLPNIESPKPFWVESGVELINFEDLSLSE